MTTLTRRTLLALLAAAPFTALAAEKKEVFVKLTPIVVEFWDQGGIFHIVHMDLSVAFHGDGKVDKLATERVQQALSALTWEEFSKGNPAATIKAVALEIIRTSKGSEKALDVLIVKMMVR